MCDSLEMMYSERQAEAAIAEKKRGITVRRMSHKLPAQALMPAASIEKREKPSTMPAARPPTVHRLVTSDEETTPL